MQIRRFVLISALAFGLSALPATALARTFYVNPATGSDSVFQGPAQNPATPVKTVKRALTWAISGDTVLVVVPSPPSTVNLADTVTIESKRDAASGSPITIRCQIVQLCVWQPPAGTNGFFISHNNHVVDGFKVVGGTIGIRVGAHDGGNGAMFGGLVQNNLVQNTTSNGIQCANCQGVEIAFNTVTGTGLNGIHYQGNASLIHDNTASNNAQFGIYVLDGVDHQVWANVATGNGQGQIKIDGTLLFQQRTLYVALTGSDTFTPEQAQSPTTPWRTIQKGLSESKPGDTILVLPGAYAGGESKADGTAAFPIVLRSSVPGGATIQGSGDSALFIEHHHHAVDGFVVTGGTNGIQIGPHAVASGPVNGGVVMNAIVHANTLAGVKFNKVQGGAVMHSVVHGNGEEGIVYGGTGASNANIFNNLVHGNGLTGSGKYGIQLTSGGGHLVTNNTVHANVSGGLRLGNANNTPVFSTVRNNIVTDHPVGVKEPTGASYTGLAILDYNNVHNSGAGAAYQLRPLGSQVGTHSISLPPGYVNAAALDFRLSRVDAGQPVDSPCIDRGSTSADALGLAGRTAFTDKLPDGGLVDLGYHGTLLKPTNGTATVASIAMTFLQTIDGDSFTLAGRLAPAPGAEGDGLGLGTDYVQIRLGSLVFFLPVANFTPQGGNTWSYAGPAPITGGTFTKNPGDGSVDLSVTGTSLNLAFSDGPLSVQFWVGDDSGSVTVPMRGTLLYP